MYLRKNDAVIGVTSTQEINIYFLVNQLKSIDSNKITLTYTSWSYGTLWKFPFSCSLFTSLLSPPWRFTLPHHLPHTPFFTSPSHYPKRSYQLPSSVLFIPLPQTKYLLPHLFNTAFVRSLCHTTSFSAFKHFSCLPPVMLTNNCAALRLLCAAVLTYLLGLFDSGCCLSLAEFTVCRVLK